MTLNSRIFSTIVAAVAAAVVFGCAAREIPPRYFVATVTASSRPEGPVGDEVRTVVPSAGARLKSGRATVSFLPPPWCIGPAEENAHAQWEQKECFALIAALERRAAEQGYRVVDWRRLQPDPHGIAIKEAVDALFVIDDVSARKTTVDGLTVTEIDVTEQIAADRRVPATLENRQIVTARCDGAIRARQRRSGEGRMMTGLALSLKMVSTSDGSAQWIYQHDERLEDVTETASNDYYYLSEGTKKTKKGKIAWGITALSLGVAAVVSGVHLNKEGTSFATRNLGFGLAWVSILPFTVGLTMTTVGLVAQAKPPVYQSPDEVVCARPPFTENPFSLQGTPAAPAVESDTATPSDALLQNKVVDHFFSALSRLNEERAVRPVGTEIPAPSESPVQATPAPAPPPSSASSASSASSVPEKSAPVQAPSPHVIVIKKDPDKRAADTGGGNSDE